MYPSPLTPAYAQDPLHTLHSVWTTVSYWHTIRYEQEKSAITVVVPAKEIFSLSRRLERLWFHAHSWPDSIGKS